MDGKNQKTFLSDDEIERIVDTFNQGIESDDFSVHADYEAIKSSNYSFSAGQYFEVKVEYMDITAEEFEGKMARFKSSLYEKFKKGRELEESIMKQLEGLKYE